MFFCLKEWSLEFTFLQKEISSQQRVLQSLSWHSFQQPGVVMMSYVLDGFPQ
jgi:hypothetical protein